MHAPETDKESVAFVDAHHHLWDLRSHKYEWLEGEGDPKETAWLGDYSQIRRSYLLEEFLRDASPSGLAKSVHVQAKWGGPDLAGETRWLQGLADRYGFPQGIVAEVDLRASDAERQLERHAECPNFRGVRMLPMAGLVTDMAFRRGMAALSRRKLCYDLNTRVPWMAEGVDLARRFADTTILVCNTGNPMARTEDYFQEWRKEMVALSALPNVVVKISGLGMSDHAWTVDSIRRWILTAIDLFGTERSVFASNWPVDGLFSTYGRLIDAYRTITTSFSPSQRKAMFCVNAERYYRI